MIRFTGGLALAFIAATGFVGLARAAEDEDIKKARAVILEMAKDIEGGKKEAAAAAAAKLKKADMDLDAIMTAYKPTKSKGIGFGKLGGIETKFNDLSKRVDAKALKDDEKELIRMGYINLAMHEITKQYAPTKDSGAKTAKAWLKFNEEMKEGTDEFIKAVKGGKPAEVKKAATRVAAACNECHSLFRD